MAIAIAAGRSNWPDDNAEGASAKTSRLGAEAGAS